MYEFFFTRKSRHLLQRFTVPSLDWYSATRKISDRGTRTHDLQIHLPHADLWLFQIYSEISTSGKILAYFFEGETNVWYHYS
jgi:hypothetical protein